MKTRNNAKLVWDVVVIGGGPAGMMAASRAAELGASVLLLEQNPTLGKKLLLTGGGRCNLTNNKPNINTLVAQYSGNTKFLFSAFKQFGIEQTLEFFNNCGLTAKEEDEGRVFPTTDSAQSVLEALVCSMKANRVKIQTKTAVSAIKHDLKKKEFRILLAEGDQIIARSCVVATGGTARPETGSTGDGFRWLSKLGHTVTANDASLVPIALTDAWVKTAAGVTLTGIKLTVVQDDKKLGAHPGKVLFTHVGISGPTVLRLSKKIGELLRSGSVRIELDLFPKLDHGQLKHFFIDRLAAEPNKKIRNTLGRMIAPALVAPFLELAGVDGNIANNQLTRDFRTAIIARLKSIPLNVKGLLGLDKAIVSHGGVDPKQVNFNTMESKVVSGLYLVGDVLDIDRPSGGYSLQLCWTTGYLAGENCRQTDSRAMA